VAFGRLQPFDDFRMRFVHTIVCHMPGNIPPGGYYSGAFVERLSEA
jgi:hypothetical protein